MNERAKKVRLCAMFELKNLTQDFPQASFRELLLATLENGFEGFADKTDEQLDAFLKENRE